MEDAFLDHLKLLRDTLTFLDLSEPGASLSEEALIDFMSVVGPSLTHLDLSKHDLITETFLMEGLQQYTRVLTSLSLNHVQGLTNEGVADFFAAWASSTQDADVSNDVPNPPLISLDLSRNPNLSSGALCEILLHSGSSLQHLNINGWKSVSEASLKEIPQRAKDLRTLDVGFCREVDDFLLKEVMDGCQRLKELKCFGCNRVSGNFPRKVSPSLFGP